MKTLWVAVTVVILSHSAFAKPAKKAVRRNKPSVTVIDLSGPSSPDGTWPTIAQKGHL